MYSCMDAYNGQPPRLYRTLYEISRDISRIRYQIEETEQQLSVDNILIELIPTWAKESPDEWIPELESIVAEANEGLLRLSELRDELEFLIDEMEEVKCVLRN